MRTPRNLRIVPVALVVGWLVALGGQTAAQDRGTGPLARPPQVAKKESAPPATNPISVAPSDSLESRPLPVRKREAAGNDATRGAGDALPGWGSSLGGLAVVIGIALAAAWTLKKMQPAGAERLPAEVVESLGRVPLVAGQQMHLVRCGAKLLLLSVTAQGAKTLTEITDPAEVARMTELCRPATTGKGAARA